ncbi:MAG TPA: hypothetical protein VEQ40_06670, partial [Pyrinomonadaceae bacterium]|nr:hypothetical protein [Pyrinomonadaceae bacterium]
QPTPQWQGGQQQQQQPPWMPPGQQQPQGQNWGGGYPQRGQAPAGYAVPHAAQATKGQALSLITLLVGVISLLTLALIFAMSLRVIVPDGDVIQAAFYISGISGIIAFLLGIVTLISSRWRNKWMAILGLVISIPSILFFLYVIIDKGLP